MPASAVNWLRTPVYREDGTYAGTRAVLYQWPSLHGSGFDSWIPVCSAATCTEEDPCLVAGRLPNSETFCHQYMPSVAVVSGIDALGRPSSRAAWLWYDTRDSPETLIASPKGSLPWETSSAGFGNAWWGDYSNGVTWLGKAFFGAWADARDLRFGARVYGASFGV